MSQQEDAAIRRAQELAAQGKKLGNEFNNSPSVIREKAEAAWKAANDNKKS